MPGKERLGRRKDRAVTDREKIKAVIRRCGVMNLAFADRGEPYVVPVNFGFEEENGQIVFYIHGAGEGKKASLIRETGRAAFSMYASCELELAKTSEPDCRSTMRYDSVCGLGSMEEVTGWEEKKEALERIMRQYSPKEDFCFEEASVSAVSVYRLRADHITGKSSR